MNNYDFLILSPIEFENLTRDLIQKKENVFIESFKSGRDNGIDLRYATPNLNNVIIQAKRYESYSNLLTNLKKEIKKVRILNPNRYLISTTVGLTPKNKQEIQNLFKPYIRETEDILGKDDLNNLLSLNNDIELKYYKLWLSSSTVLDRLLNNRIYNYSEFELSEMKDQMKTYVQNESFSKAIKIITEYKYVIISGIPGIGKTTLARIISLHFLSGDYDEFIFLSDSIDDGYTLFHEEKKQIFFFDDFLGKNFLDAKQKPNEESKIIKFIERIKRSNNKLLILSTREYILNQAISSYEVFRINNIEIAKCILDLDSYTNVIKAQILYNHLFFAGIPKNHLNNLVDPKNHLGIVKHKNYNPRIIETLIKRKIWNSCAPNEFSKNIIILLDNPESVWHYAFENSINKYSQYTLLILLTLGSPVKIEDLEEALISFLEININKIHLPVDLILVKRSLKELENTFIKIQNDSATTIAVDFQNPSIIDFLLNYLRDKTEIIESLMDSFIFENQYFNIFDTTQDGSVSNKKIILSEKIQKNAFEKIKKNIEILKNCILTRVNIGDTGRFLWKNLNSNRYSFLTRIYKDFNIPDIEKESFIKEEFIKLLYPNKLNSYEHNLYIQLLKDLKLENLDEERIIITFLQTIRDLHQLKYFKEFAELFPIKFDEHVKKETFYTYISNLVSEEIQKTDGLFFDSLKEEIEKVESTFNLNLEDQLYELAEKITDYEEFVESQIERYIDEESENQYNPMSEDQTISEIFNSFDER
ncbi:restriction endonuclease [Leptospira congkakensis]|nr:restriction endonuclease [Leptospira congkakensis]